MHRSHLRSRAVTGARLGGLVTVLACAVPWLAACEATSGGDAGESPSAAESAVEAEPSGAAAPAPGDDAELKLRLAEFDAVAVSVMEPMGYAVPVGFRTPVDLVANFASTAVDVVEPSACTGFHGATALATDQDLGAPGQDIFNPAGPFVPGGELIDGAQTSILSVDTRIFGDETLAATMRSYLLDSDCADYTRTSTWDTGEQVLEHQVGEVSEVQLAGLAAPTVKVTFSGGTSTLYNAAGDLEGVESRGAWNHYLHVAGPNAIAIDVVGMDDEEAVVGSMIAAFIDHMSAA